MRVDMLVHPRSCHPPQVEADVETVAVKGLAQDGHATGNEHEMLVAFHGFKPLEKAAVP